MKLEKAKGKRKCHECKKIIYPGETCLVVKKGGGRFITKHNYCDTCGKIYLENAIFKLKNMLEDL